MTDQTDKAALPGHAADSPGNAAGPAPGRYMERPAGWAAVGHPTEQSRDITVMHQQQNRTPRPGASLATVYGAEGPLGSSIQQHQGRAQVEVLDQVAAANPTLAGQLGPRAPSGIPGQPGDHIAPSTTGEVRDRMAAPPAMFYDRIPGQLQGGPA